MEDSDCNLEIDVNGEQVFFVNKEILSSFSGTLRKLLIKSAGGTPKRLKVILHDLPGGANGFELMARFCYNNGKALITPSNVAFLHSVALFMDMTTSHTHTHSLNLIELTEITLKEIAYWSWFEILEALRQCQCFVAAANSSGLLHKLLDSLVARLVAAIDECPSTSSSDSCGFRLSCDTRSTQSVKNGTNWWFDNLLALNPELIQKAGELMLSRKLDNVIMTRFLLYYQKSRLSGATLDDKCKITETVIDLLYRLEYKSVPYKSLFDILRVSLSLNLSKSCRNKLENMIGSQLDQATMDNLLVPSPPGVNMLYDVNLVIRLLKSFLLGGDSWVSVTRLKKVATVMDLYIAEVAPDPCLKPSKFVALVKALPNSARDSYDEIYRSVDMYLEVHAGGVSDEEKMMICSAVNYEKLSLEAYKHVAENSKLQAVEGVSCQQLKLRSLLEHTTCPTENDNKEMDQIVLYAKKLDLSTENEMLKESLRGMQWRVMELEKACSKMHTQVGENNQV